MELVLGEWGLALVEDWALAEEEELGAEEEDLVGGEKVFQSQRIRLSRF